MSTGDMTVVGQVSDQHLVEDIGVWVPRGVAVTIAGELTLRSKDLHRSIAQGQVALLHTSQVRASAVSGNAERANLEAQVQQLTAQKEALQARNEFLENQVETLQVEVSTYKSQHEKLDAILSALQERPVTSRLGETVSAPKSALVQLQPTPAVSGDVPMFIPSQIRPETSEERVAIPEEQSSTSSVNTAAGRLRAMRKNRPQ